MFAAVNIAEPTSGLREYDNESGCVPVQREAPGVRLFSPLLEDRQRLTNHVFVIYVFKIVWSIKSSVV